MKDLSRLAVPAPFVERLRRPPGADTNLFNWPYVTGVVGVHLLAMLAFLPWFFSWTGLIAAVLGMYVFGTLGINLCYHRLLTHTSFRCSKRLEHCFALLGVCSMQGPPGGWVATHRLHHQHSDEEQDPHSPLVSFVWGHFGWLLVQNRQLHTVAALDHYARDILRDPFYLRLERGARAVLIYLIHAALFFAAGFCGGWIATGQLPGGLQLGASLLVWGVFVRTVLVWHTTWSVNSLTHIWGYRNYHTRENSRNNWFVALISNGEGWHNNHHADQRAAAHGHRAWEFDVTWLTIRGLSWLGLVDAIVLPQAWSHQATAEPAADHA